MLFKDLNKAEFALMWEMVPLDQIAAKLKTHKRTLQTFARTMGLPPKQRIYSEQPAIAFPANAGEDYDKQIKLTRDRCLIIGDVEIPDHHIPTLEMAVEIARKFGIKTLLINGDFVALDSFSMWAKSQINKVFFKQEREGAVIALEVFLQTFEDIFMDSGNHELRLPHAVDGQMSFGDFLEQLAGVTFSEYAHMDLTSGGKEILVTHQKNFSIVPLSVPSKLAVARHRNVWCAHNHRLAWGYDPSSLFWIVEGGHCRDEMKTHYKNIRVTTHPMWNPGFGFIIDGMPYLINKDNFKFWMSLQVGQIEVELKKERRKRTKKVNPT